MAGAMLLQVRNVFLASLHYSSYAYLRNLFPGLLNFTLTDI